MGGRALLAATAPVAVVVGGSLVACGGAERHDSSASAGEVATATARVERGALSASFTQDGILTYRARPDGTPYAVVNHARGTITRVPAVGDRVACGDPLYRVDDDPVILLCGSLPSYRDLALGDAGRDVRQLNANLHRLGFDRRAALNPNHAGFTWETQQALQNLQRVRGLTPTGRLARADAVVLPSAVRIAKVAVQLGETAQPGGQVAQATSDVVQVRVNLSPAQQGEVERGDRARITLPGNRSIRGTVERLGAVAKVPDGQGASAAAAAAIPAYVRLDQPAQARGLDEAPVRVEVATEGVDDVLSVPVLALAGKAGGGFAVEVVRGASRTQVAVSLGLFDANAGRVEVEGAIQAGDLVVVPSP